MKLIFSGCRTVGQPVIAHQLRCTISMQFNKCRCHLYDLPNAVRVSEAQDYPLEYCEDLTGFTPTSWASDITPWARESIRFYNDTCK
jgi:hypothetical protein